MTRLTRIIISLVLFELAVIAVGVPSWRWPIISEALSAGGVLHRLNTVRLAIVGASPLILLLAWAVFERRLASPSSLAPARKGYAEAGLIVVAFFLMAYQAWFASHLGQGHEAPATRELALRLGAIIAGMVMAVQGNFSAKVAAPEGFDPALWTRGRLRSGWALSLAGLAIAVCAIVLPLPRLFPVFLMLGLAAISYVLVQRRSLIRGGA